MSEWSDINTAMDAAAQVGRDDGHEEPEPPAQCANCGRYEVEHRRKDYACDDFTPLP